MKVNNMSANSINYKWEVARKCDGELWHWGAWNDFAAACTAAQEINGIVIPMSEVELV